MAAPEHTLNLYRLHVFRLVTRSGSFSQTAERLHTSQPNISKHMQQLENELGVDLFERSGSRAILTDVGRIVLDYADRIFDQVGELYRALDELQGLERGFLRLGASSTAGLYILPPVIARFWDRYSKLEVTLEIGNSGQIVERIQKNELDLGFVEGIENVPGIQSQIYLTDRLIWIASSQSDLARNPTIQPGDLNAEKFIWRENGSSTRQIMAQWIEDHGIQPQRSIQLLSCEGVKRGVISGLGISLVSARSIEMELAEGSIVIIPVEDFNVEQPLNIISRKDHRSSVITLAFLAFLHKSIF